MLGWKVCCSVFWGNMNKTRYSATEFGGNKPMNFRLSGTLILFSVNCLTSRKKQFGICGIEYTF